MAATSSEIAEAMLLAVAKALRVVKLDAVVIGNTASMLNGAPVTTQDMDLLIRDTKLNRRKLAQLAKELRGSAPSPVSDLSRVEVIESGVSLPVEVHYDRISGGLTFAAVKARAQAVSIGREKLVVASLADVIRSKESANRPKDRAVLPILRDTLALEKKP
jgi:hypothetical protein